MRAFPLPPEEILNQPVNHTGQTIMNIAIAIGVVAVYATAIRLARVHRTPVPVVVALGSTFCALIEPMPDILANLWYYAPGQDTFYTSFENPFPVWTFFSYTAFYGGLGLIFWRLVEAGWSRRRLVPVCAGMAVYLAVAEIFMINVMEVYTYYGPAAFVVADFPIWIPLLNTFIVLTVGLGAARIRRSLPTREQFVPAFFLPAVAMVLGLVMIPLVLWTYIHSADPEQGVVYAATILTIGIAIAMMHTTMRFIPAEGFTPIGTQITPSSASRAISPDDRPSSSPSTHSLSSP